MSPNFSMLEQKFLCLWGKVVQDVNPWTPELCVRLFHHLELKMGIRWERMEGRGTVGSCSVQWKAAGWEGEGQGWMRGPIISVWRSHGDMTDSMRWMWWEVSWAEGLLCSMPLGWASYILMIFNVHKNLLSSCPGQGNKLLSMVLCVASGDAGIWTQVWQKHWQVTQKQSWNLNIHRNRSFFFSKNALYLHILTLYIWPFD